MNKTAMGFDYGTKRIGIAAGQALTRTAQGIATISNSGRHGPWSDIEKLIREWRPDVLVVGLPLGREGCETELSRAARLFASALGERFDLPVDFIDETLTSRSAEARISQATPVGKRIKEKRENLRDQIAAELILETYLDEYSRKSHVS